VLVETDSGGTVTAYYIYGLGLISRINSTGNAQYYHFDSRGSTVALTDATGQTTDAYAYDPFGVPRGTNGFTDNRFRYLGRHGVVDEENGLNYVRARYYSARRGRFITKDPTTGKDGDSQSLNRYIYALNNPVRLIDISGLSAGETSGTIPHLITSDPSRFNNYLISPGTGGLAIQTANSTPAYVLNGGNSGVYLKSAAVSGIQKVLEESIQAGARAIVNNNGFNALGTVGFGVHQGAGPLVGAGFSAYEAYTDTIAHPDRNNYEMLARFNIDLTTHAVEGLAIVGASSAILALGAPVAVVAGGVAVVTIAVGAVTGANHDAIQDTLYNGVNWGVNWVGGQVSNLFP